MNDAVEAMMTATCPAKTCGPGEHYWVTSIYNGDSISQCAVCEEFNWDELRRDYVRKRIIDRDHPAFARPFHLVRHDDVTGVSGEGIVADGVKWPDGTVALRWRGEDPSTIHRDTLESVEKIHGHDGRTRIVFPKS
ncbi:hypothetical protein [Actinomadura atramentaria]|uniref:hypothetical protein n=1 Tax=Actinomadura atramentaria TaxID=1990 RepID=UPI00037D704F|nr:hypothetical protein [Actinomadura atramentaria]